MKKITVFVDVSGTVKQEWWVDDCVSEVVLENLVSEDKLLFTTSVGGRVTLKHDSKVIALVTNQHSMDDMVYISAAFVDCNNIDR
jgi:hypothetical protein